MTKSTFWKLDKLGYTRLSQHFYMRQFLYSEIAEAYGIANIPEDADLAIETGTQLCAKVLEPIVKAFGPIIIRSGYRSPTLNDFGYRNRLMCGSNEDNLAYHIWDKPNKDGYKGAAACIIVPGIKQYSTELETRQAFADWIHSNLDYHGGTFFKRGNCLGIGWHEKPERSIYNLPTSQYLIKKDQLI